MFSKDRWKEILEVLSSNVMRTIATAFGVGWGISGLCPGSAIASIGIGNWPILLGIVGMLLGAYVKERTL